MTENGYIKLHRSILSWEWWSDDATFKVFVWMLLNANWEDSRYKGVDIPKGSLIIGRKIIARECHLTEQNVRTALNHLKSTNEITTKSTNKFTVASIVNWEKYQCFENESTNKLTNKLTSNQPTTNHIKEYKEYKEYKKNGFKNFTQSSYDWDEINRELGIK